MVRNLASLVESTVKTTSSHFVNGWFWPGDLGHFLPNGRLELTGRKDDLINVGGIKVNPALAEGKLRSLDYVEDAAVLMGSGANGAQVVVVAVVFTATGRMERLQKETAAGMAAFGHLVEWAQVDSIPRTPTGKIQRAALRAQLKDRCSPARSSPKVRGPR
jgi:acyl-coenzyme A synthetase/AMP-(fatty) acid ligase